MQAKIEQVAKSYSLQISNFESITLQNGKIMTTYFLIEILEIIGDHLCPHL